MGICRDLGDNNKSVDFYCLKTLNSQNDNDEAADLLTVNFSRIGFLNTPCGSWGIVQMRPGAMTGTYFLNDPGGQLGDCSSSASDRCD